MLMWYLIVHVVEGIALRGREVFFLERNWVKNILLALISEKLIDVSRQGFG